MRRRIPKESLRNVTEYGAIDPKETDDFQECYIAFLWRGGNEIVDMSWRIRTREHMPGKTTSFH